MSSRFLQSNFFQLHTVYFGGAEFGYVGDKKDLSGNFKITEFFLAEFDNVNVFEVFVFGNYKSTWYFFEFFVGDADDGCLCD